MTTLALYFKQDRPVDKYVLWSALILAGVGVASVYSAITYFAETQAGGNTNRLLVSHLLRVTAAIGLMGLFSVIDYRLLAKFSRFALILTLGFLVAVQLVGVAYGGATRWLKIGGLAFQPSDPARVALILFVSLLLARKQAYIKSFTRSFAPIFMWILLAVALIGIEAERLA
jgi:cell division protein FtsW